MSKCYMSKSYLNGRTNSLDDYLYIDENENLSEENPTVQNGTQHNGSQENVIVVAPYSGHLRQYLLNKKLMGFFFFSSVNCVLSEKIFYKKKKILIESHELSGELNFFCFCSGQNWHTNPDTPSILNNNGPILKCNTEK